MLMKTPNNKIKQFFEKYTNLNFKRGEVILSPCQSVNKVFYLKKGFVKQYMLNKDGRIKAVNIYKPGAYFPIVLALAKYQNRYYFEAINAVTVLEAPVNEVLEFVQKDPIITAELLTRFYIGVDGVLNILESLMYETSQKKLAAFLLMLSARFGEACDKGTRLVIPLTHQDLASFTGMIRETVSFEMKKLQSQGIIAKNRCRKTITIKNLSALKKIVG